MELDTHTDGLTYVIEQAVSKWDIIVALLALGFGIACVTVVVVAAARIGWRYAGVIIAVAAIAWLLT
jgi:hypothetical protein